MRVVSNRKHVMATLVRLLKCEAGASAAEYALILAIVGSAMALAALALGGAVSGSMNAMSDRLGNCGDGTC